MRGAPRVQAVRPHMRYNVRIYNPAFDIAGKTPRNRT